MPKNQVVIKGDIAGLEDGVEMSLAVRENKIWVKLDSCIVSNGKFQLKTIVDEPRLAYVMDFENPASRISLLIEPATMTVTGTVGDDNMIIKGSKLHDEYQAIIENEDMELMKSYIQTHPKSFVSLLLITTELIYYASMQELELYKSWIDPALYNTKAMKEIDERIVALQRFEPGQPAPDISLPDPDGVIRTLSDLRGKYVLVDFWASWCPDCRKENPAVVEVYQKFHDQGFEIFSVSLDNNKEAWLNAIEKDNLTWTYHVSELKRWSGEVSQAFGVNAIPTNLLIDPEGKIVARNVFGSELHDLIYKVFDND